MTLWLLILHVFNFALPALAMALLMPWVGRWVLGAGLRPWHQHMVWHALMGMGVLTLCLWLQGHDGTMAAYAALVLSAATLEWLLRSGWRQR
jgi:hypothetical protein